jgi:hypothetical protein
MEKPTPRAIIKSERTKHCARRQRWWVDQYGPSPVLFVTTAGPQKAASAMPISACVLNDRQLLAGFIKIVKSNANHWRAEHIASYPYPLN